MSAQSRRKKRTFKWADLISSLIVTLFFSMGAIATWTAMVRWLPTEQVEVRVIDSNSRSSSRVRPVGSSISYWIKTVDANGLSQNISCIRETYSALTPIGINRNNLKLIRNPWTKTPVAFLRTPTNLLNIDPDSALGKVLAAGPAEKKTVTPERLELIKYPAVFLIIGVAFMVGAVWIFMRFLKIASNRFIATAATIISTGVGTVLGIYWSSGLL